MNSKKLKYAQYLLLYPDCPGAEFMEIEALVYRWIQSDGTAPNDFKPIHLISDPPDRILDNDDLMCKGYGLSLYDSQQNALDFYRHNYIKRAKNDRLREIFKSDKGQVIAEIPVVKDDGVAGDKNNWGHFTFHEYEMTDLQSKITGFFNIFEENGDIKV